MIWLFIIFRPLTRSVSKARARHAADLVEIQEGPAPACQAATFGFQARTFVCQASFISGLGILWIRVHGFGADWD